MRFKRKGKPTLDKDVYITFDHVLASTATSNRANSFTT